MGDAVEYLNAGNLRRTTSGIWSQQKSPDEAVRYIHHFCKHSEKHLGRNGTTRLPKGDLGANGANEEHIW